MVGIVFDAVDVRGELRTTFDLGTTDGVRWFDLEEIANLPTHPVSTCGAPDESTDSRPKRTIPGRVTISNCR